MYGDELKISSCLVGILSVVWGGIMFFPTETHSIVLALLSRSEMAWFGLILGASGAFTMLGALVPMRGMRQWGLALSAVCWFSLIGVFINLWLFPFAMWACVVLGTYAMVVLLWDVKNKPRYSCPFR